MTMATLPSPKMATIVVFLQLSWSCVCTHSRMHDRVVWGGYGQRISLRNQINVANTHKNPKMLMFCEAKQHVHEPQICKDLPIHNVS